MRYMLANVSQHLLAGTRYAGKRRRPVIGGVETVGIRISEAGNHRGRTRILNPFVEPKRRQIAALIECLDGLTLILVDEKLFAFRSQEIANLFCDGAIVAIKKSEWIGWPRGLVCRDSAQPPRTR